MNNKQTQNNLSRLEFLKSTGLLAAGITLAPGLLFAGNESLAAVDDLAINSLADYRIVVPANAAAIETHAAEQLKQYLSALSTVALEIVPETGFTGKNGIYIGQTNFAKTQNVSAANLEGDAYTYKKTGNNLVILGGADKGVLFGVYDLLEGIGFRKYAPDYVHIPQDKKGKAIHIAEKTFTPKITYRTTSYGSMGNAEHQEWNKLNSRSVWGLFVHTFETLVPPKEYGKTHPEYFSLIKGVRQPETQLCLSNQEVVDVLVANLKKRVAEKPTAKYWSVSQNDNDQHCTCDGCKALDEKYGGVPSGSIIHFTNKVAKEFPDKIISTLAYWYSRKAPKGLKIEPNVNIMLCNIESRRHAPVYDTDPAFSNDLRDWGALTNDILIWDYNIQFTNFIAPFPNLYTIKPNIKFYTDNHVNALYMQSNNEPAAEMALLRSYLITNLMWRPDADDKQIIDEFLNGYYGAGGPFIRKYIDRMQESLVASKMSLNIFGDPIDAKEAFLSAAMMAEYKQLFDQAENAVKGNDVLVRRVQVARLPIQYAEIQIGRTEIDTPRSMFQRNPQGITLAKPAMKALVSKFVDGCKRENVKLVRERAGSPEHFLASYTRIFNNMEQTAKTKSFGKTVNAVASPDEKSVGVKGLTDGVFASYESWQQADTNWVFYTGQHMDFVLDLGAVVPVSSINMDFLNPQAQPNWHLFALPKHVSYSLSIDGKTFGNPVQINNPHNPNPIENPEISKISIQPFKADFSQQKARYVKVHAESLLKTPSWHIRSGQPISIYTDQIVVS